jgi:hypothetical protein
LSTCVEQNRGVGFGDSWTPRQRVGFLGVLVLFGVGLVLKYTLPAALLAGLLAWSWTAAVAGAAVGIVALARSQRRGRSYFLHGYAAAAIVGVVWRVALLMGGAA